MRRVLSAIVGFFFIFNKVMVLVDLECKHEMVGV